MGPWVFATAVLIFLGTLSAQSSIFRKYLLRGIAAIIALTIGAYFISEWQGSALEATQKAKIRLSDVETRAFSLSLPRHGDSIATLIGEVANNSSFAITKFEYTVVISRCKAQLVDCKSIYSKKESFYIDIPPHETRNLNYMMMVDGLPILEYWSWNIFVTAVWAE
jgi:hypothetical protein